VEAEKTTGSRVSPAVRNLSKELFDSLHLKVDPSEQGARSSGLLPRGADSISQPGEAEKTTGGSDSPVVRNILSLPIEGTSLGASSSGIPPQGAGGSRKPADLEPIALAYHRRELVVPANLWTKVTFYM
jgi:hypothetical protein